MYSAWLSNKNDWPLGKCFYDNSIPESSLALQDPELSLKANAAGEFSFGIAPTQLYYDSFEKMTSIVTIIRDDKIIWEGRIIEEEMDFFKQKKFKCEGAMAYFNDTIQPRTVDSPDSSISNDPANLRRYLQRVLNYHNIQCGSDENPGDDDQKLPDRHKVFNLGYVSSLPPGLSLEENYFETDYDITLECLNKIINDFGGYYVITWGNDRMKTLNYIADHEVDSLGGDSIAGIAFKKAEQKIEFGMNMLDYTRSYDMTELCTVVVPVGDTVKIGGGWVIKVQGADDYIYNDTGGILRFAKKKDAEEYAANEGLDMEYYEIIEMDDEKEIAVDVTTIGDITDPVTGTSHVSGTPYIFSESAVANFGWICKKVDFETTDPETLYHLGVAYLVKGQFAKMNIEITAFDMALLNEKVDGLPAISK